MCKYVDNLSFLRKTLNKFFLLVILTWSGVRSCSKILQKRLKRRHILPSAQEMEKESSLDQRVKNHGNGWLTSTKTQVWTEEKTLWGRVLLVTAVKLQAWETFSYHGYALRLIFMHWLVTIWQVTHVYAASWNLFTLTAEADRVLCQLVMLHWMYQMSYTSYQESSVIHGWFVFWVFGWEMRRLSKLEIRFRVASFSFFTLLDA